MKKVLFVIGLGLVFLFALAFTASRANGATGSPSRSFAPSAPWPGNDVGATSGDARAVIAGDLDHDGDDDVASGDTSGNVIVWRNDGTPFNGLWVSNTVGNCGAVVYALALADFDNDGNLDLASGCSTAAAWEIVAWRNDGTPFTGGWAANGVGGAAHVLALAVGDLDNDGYLDLVSGDSSAVIDAWHNDGAPFSGAWTVQIVGNTTNATYAVAVGDLDDDGDLDIASGDANDSLKVWQNDGTPFSGAWTSTTAGTGKDTFYAVALADLDGDGDLDMISDLESADATDYQVAAWQNDGTPFTGSWTVKLVGVTDDAVYAVAAADLDSDGRADIVSGSSDTGATYELVAWSSPASPFADTWITSTVGASADEVNSVALADLDHDGDPDIVSGSSSVENYELVAWQNANTPKSVGSWSAIVQPAPAYKAMSAALADFDHDGKLDIAAGHQDEGVIVWRGDGGSTWTRVGATKLPITDTYRDVAWGQINNRTDIDLAAAKQGGGLKAWLAWEGGGDWDDISSGLPTSGDYYAVAQGDVDHDGLLDLAAGGVGVGVRAWRWLGAGPPYWDAKTILSSTLDFCDVALGHINHDGNLDIVATNCNDGGIPVWLGDGGFSFTYAASPTSTGSYTALALGDLNNDGDTDVVAADKGSGVRTWLGNGGSGWVYVGIISPSLTVLGLDLGDYDRNGQLDLVLGLQSGGVRVLQGKDGTSWTDASAGLPNTGTFEDVKFGRVDADAMLDIVAAESGASGARVWTAFEPPPGGWNSFRPTDWVITQVVTATVRVIDTGSGLDVNTAEYRFSNTGAGGLTDTWFPAACSGAISTTTAQTITASNVPFNRDSATQNVTQFRIRDMAGLTGTSPVYNVFVDSTPPSNPAGLSSTSHTVGAWSDDTSINFTWTHTGTDNVSGVDGYSYRLTQNATDTPDQIIDHDAGTDYLPVTQYATADGDWYFHLMTRDMASNWSAPAHLGPYRIDTADPTTPTLDYSSHVVGGWSNDNTIYARWNASDGGSLEGYSFVWDDHPSLYVDVLTDTVNNYVTSGALADDQWYLHVRAVDRAGNAGGIAHFGPFGVDTADPYSCWINAPATCGSSCTIEWSYYDATSGVASYDVQVRYEDAATPTWEDWLLSTTGTSAVYTDTSAHGVYSFHVRARDRAGNVSGYDCSEQTIVDDLYAYELEVTQGIQNLDNDVPLIADKTTYVRFYVASYGDVPNVDARLHGTRGGVALPSSPLRPTGGRITTHFDAGNRDDLNDSFYFRLPSEWRSGTVTLRAVVNPAHDVAETDYADNEITETVTFESSGDFCIVMVPVHLHPQTYFIDDDPAFWDIIEMAERILPVRSGIIDIWSVGEEYPEGHSSGWEYGLPQDFDVVIQDLKGVDFWTDDPCHNTHYWGMTHPSHLSGRWGMAYYPPGDEGSGVMDSSTAFDSDYPSWMYPLGGVTLAHELGHNFDRHHVNCGNPKNPGYYPYPACQIAPDDPAGYFGFVTPILGGAPEIITPTEATPLMSYGWPQWIDDYTYRAYHDWLRSSMRAQDEPMVLPPAWAQATEYLYASGTISPTAQTAVLQAFYRTSQPDTKFVARSLEQELKTQASSDVYSLELQDASGVSIYTHTFTATVADAYGYASDDLVFDEVLPYDNRTVRIALKQGSTTLASRSVSAHTPIVTLLSPNGGETIADQLLISWMASDADGDALRYAIQYSPDDGTTWRSLDVDWIGTSFTVTAKSLNLLPGSNQARIHVTATDGVNTASDQSNATFTLARKPPRAHILEPLGGSQFNVGETIVFRGTGLDAEDGSLNATSAITWTSSMSGTLGVGTELGVSDLLTGAHRITMTVTDRDGDVGTDEVIVFVGVSPNKIYLPIVLKN